MSALQPAFLAAADLCAGKNCAAAVTGPCKVAATSTCSVATGTCSVPDNVAEDTTCPMNGIADSGRCRAGVCTGAGHAAVPLSFLWGMGSARSEPAYRTVVRHQQPTHTNTPHAARMKVGSGSSTACAHVQGRLY